MGKLWENCCKIRVWGNYENNIGQQKKGYGKTRKSGGRDEKIWQWTEHGITKAVKTCEKLQGTGFYTFEIHIENLCNSQEN